MTAAGTRIAGYEILEPLGSGGMAAVYLALESNLQREVALKLLPPAMQRNSEYLERFQREARALARLEHPHVVPIYAFGVEHGTPWMSMRCLRGGSLEQRLREGVAPASMLRWLGQVAEALDHAHAHGVVHRDIKPSNVLLDEQGDAYLSDFGISKLSQHEATLTGGSLLGTPRYASPEMAQGRAVEAASDIYSLGVMAFEMLTGEPPFDAPSTYTLLKRQVEEPPPLERLPSRYRAPIARALAKLPEDRWPSAGAFVAALQAAAAAPQAAPTPTTPLPQALPAATLRTRPVTRFPLAAVGIALLAALLVALGWRWQDTASPPLPPTQPGLVIEMGVVDAQLAPFSDGFRDVLITLFARMARVRLLNPEQGGPGGEVHHRLLLGMRGTDEGPYLTITLQASDSTEPIWVDSLQASPKGETIDRQQQLAARTARAVHFLLQRERWWSIGQPRPADPRVQTLYGVGRAREMLGMHAAAEESFKAMAALDPAAGHPHAALAWLAAMRWEAEDGDALGEEVAAHLREARSRMPGLAEADIAEGCFLTWQEREYDRALELLDRAAGPAPDHAHRLLCRGFATRALGRFAEAQEDFQHALRVDPLDAWAMSNVGLLLLERRQYGPALQLFAQQRQLWPRHRNLIIWEMQTRFARNGKLAELESSVASWRNTFADRKDDALERWILIQLAVLKHDLSAAEKLAEAYPEHCATRSGYANLVEAPACMRSLRAWLLSVLGEQQAAQELVELELARLDAERRRYQTSASGEGVDRMRFSVGLQRAQLLALTGSVPQATAELPDLLATWRGMRESSTELHAGYLSMIAVTLAWSGQVDAALDELEPGLDMPFGPHAGLVANDPIWAPLHTSPRFRRMLAERGHALRPFVSTAR